MKIEELYPCPCPCCCNRSITDLGNYEICPICGWEDDPVQSGDPEFSGGANFGNLNDAKKKYYAENK